MVVCNVFPKRSECIHGHGHRVRVEGELRDSKFRLFVYYIRVLQQVKTSRKYITKARIEARSIEGVFARGLLQSKLL